MIFSEWRPDGGYNYFESSKRHGIGDDLPEVYIPSPANEVGTPAQDVGRKLPNDARPAGSGIIPMGLIVPMDRPAIGVGEFAFETSRNNLIFCGLAVILVSGLFYLKKASP